LNLALFDVDTLAQALMRAVRDDDAAALEGCWTRRRRTCGAITSQYLNDRQCMTRAIERAVPPVDGTGQVKRTV
jgi:2-polyprenyl-6-methoxyphenol hydroxylase-like FAD-dependent oxidoreductase